MEIIKIFYVIIYQDISHIHMYNMVTNNTKYLQCYLADPTQSYLQHYFYLLLNKHNDRYFIPVCRQTLQ